MCLLCIFSGEADSTTLSSQQGALDQGTGMTGMATAADDKKLLVSFSSYIFETEK